MFRRSVGLSYMRLFFVEKDRSVAFPTGTFVYGGLYAERILGLFRSVKTALSCSTPGRHLRCKFTKERGCHDGFFKVLGLAILNAMGAVGKSLDRHLVI
jgi:hypothetical protein